MAPCAPLPSSLDPLLIYNLQNNVIDMAFHNKSVGLTCYFHYNLVYVISVSAFCSFRCINGKNRNKNRSLWTISSNQNQPIRESLPHCLHCCIHYFVNFKSYTESFCQSWRVGIYMCVVKLMVQEL